MTEVITLEPKRGRRLRMLKDGEISEQLLDDIWQDEIEQCHRCIQSAAANIRRAINQLIIERDLIDRWEAKIAEIEARRGQLSVVIDFPM